MKALSPGTEGTLAFVVFAVVPGVVGVAVGAYDPAALLPVGLLFALWGGIWAMLLWGDDR